jgi:hypothetical protein
MVAISSFEEGFIEISPGFEICEIFKNKDVSIVHIRMKKILMPCYPRDPEAYSVLETDMYVTPLDGIIYLEERGFGRRLCEPGDKISILRGTEYRWILGSAMTVLHAVNTPGFKDSDRKV